MTLRRFLLCLLMIALPAQAIAGSVTAVRALCGGNVTAATPMMSRHAVLKTEAEAALQQPDMTACPSQHGDRHSAPSPGRHHGGAHDGNSAADDAASAELARGDTTEALGEAGTGEASPVSHAALGHHAGHGHHASHAGCTACDACAVGAALAPAIADLPLSHFRHMLPQTVIGAFADATPDSLLRPPAARC